MQKRSNLKNELMILKVNAAVTLNFPHILTGHLHWNAMVIKQELMQQLPAQDIP